MIRTGKLRAFRLAIPLALASVALGSCGSDGGGDTTVAKRPAVSPDTAGHLAKLSDRVATDLDDGDTCGAAYAADELKAAVEDANLPASMRASVDEVAGQLVDDVNCPPPPPAPEPEKKPKKDEHTDEHGDEHGKGDEDSKGSTPPGHAKHGGIVPPGQAKLKGELQ